MKEPWMRWVGRPIANVEEANAALSDIYVAAANDRCIVARGRIRLPSILPGFALVIHDFWPRMGEAGDIQDMGGKGLMYRASFLRQLADAAGLRSHSTVRHDRGENPHYRDIEVVLHGQDLLLRHRTWSGRYDLDLSDGSARLASLKSGQIKEKREHIAQLASTGAYSRAVVEALAIPRVIKPSQDPLMPVLVPCMEVHAASAPPEVLAHMSIQAVMAAMGAFGMTPAATAPASAGHMAHTPPAPAATAPAPELGEPPFDAPEEDFEEPPEEEVGGPPDRPINAEEVAELKRLGLYRQSELARFGWTDGPVMLSVYESALADYYRTKGGGAR